MNNSVALIILAALLFAGAATVDGQVLDPVAFTFDTSAGETIDKLGLRTDGGDVFTTADGTNYYFGLQGEDPSNPTDGLPADGTIPSASNTVTKIATFQLGPAPLPEVLLGSGTMVLTTPASYSNLAFLVNSLATSRFGAPATFTLNFSDGTFDNTLSTGENVPEWLGGEPGATGGSVALSTVAAYSYEGGEGFIGDPPTNFDEYDFSLSPDDAAKTLVSIAINDNSGQLLTYAVSGTDPPLDAPEPSTWILLGMALTGLWLVRRVRLTARP